ncbi:Uncharacterized protein Adt_31230 [Abeliophyllum distichum]|uniref:Uncharacterized protein n=1 Tax=Abeliophyllum distichum TaxID=126358 RepID=A0ABD1RH23_9LAMI
MEHAAPEMALRAGCSVAASDAACSCSAVVGASGCHFAVPEIALQSRDTVDGGAISGIEKPASITDAISPDNRRNFEKWECSNRMSLMIIKHDIPEAFRDAVSEEVTDAKKFLAEIEKRFAKNDKVETSTLL